MKKILLVDDDEIVRLTLEHQLNKKGFAVDTAENGEEAIEKLNTPSSYDLVITDLRMYGESGVDVFNKVREVDINIPVMIITGFGADSSLFKEAMELKPCSHAFKPFSNEELLEKVNNCLAMTN